MNTSKHTASVSLRAATPRPARCRLCDSPGLLGLIAGAFFFAVVLLLEHAGRF